MTTHIDLEALLQPVDDENPCGADLEDFVFDPGYTELERMAQGKPEQVMGDEVIPAEEPDWRAVRKKALELSKQVRSLRVAVFLTKALCARDGIAAMCEGLQLVHGLMEKYWDEVEPLIDEGDATERLHTLAELASEEGLLHLIRQALLVSSPAIGKFTVRDYLIASEKLKAPKGEDVVSLTTINQALMDCDLPELQGKLEAIDLSLATVDGIEKLFNEKLSPNHLIDLDPFSRLFKEVRPVIQEVLGRRGIAVESTDSGESAQPSATSGSGPAREPASGEIQSREDVVRMLDRITEYYNKNEPSSPVPLLLQRAKRLVSADFMSIIKDIASDGAQQADLLLGSKNDDE
jgi:type VI secretion system protein ImpA